MDRGLILKRLYVEFQEVSGGNVKKDHPF